MTHWFRFYEEVLNDPKVQTLPAEVFKIWVNCLCLASQNRKSNGELGTLETVSFAFRETKSTVSSAFHLLEQIGIIETVGETFHVANWKKRQFKSDVSTERVKQFRKRSRNVSETAPEPEHRTQSTEPDIPPPPLSAGAQVLSPQVSEPVAVPCPSPSPEPGAAEMARRVATVFAWLEEFFNSPRPYHCAPVVAWLGWGADFDLDIRPSAERFVKRRKGPPGTLSWLDDDIAKSIQQRRKPMPEMADISVVIPKFETKEDRATREYQEWVASKLKQFEGSSDATH